MECRGSATATLIVALETSTCDTSLPLAFTLACLFGLPIERVFQPDDDGASSQPE